MNRLKNFKQSIEHKRICSDFDYRTTVVAPQLFNLADQVLSEPDAVDRWGAVWVDDKGGRLPGLFMHHVLKGAGVQLPIRFVMGGRAARISYDYTKEVQFDRLAVDTDTSKRGLIVTDTISEGNAVGFLASRMAARYNAVDTATVALHTKKPRYLSDVSEIYAGGIGYDSIVNVNAAFESITCSLNAQTSAIRHIKNILLPKHHRSTDDHKHTYPTGGVDCRPGSGSIHARLPEDGSYRDTAHYARQRIVQLAGHYLLERR